MRHTVKKDLKVRVRGDVRERLVMEAAARDLSVSDIVREAIRLYLREQGPAAGEVREAAQ
jgi:predicted HicB family RNase H-like nuclease